jgi:murein DD-endopeptidase MepM/ murein hydrolase activator NlpD
MGGTGTAPPGTVAGGGSSAGGQIATIWGGGAPNISQEFGQTAFSQGNSDYNYGAEYSPTHTGIGHTGIDVSMNIGTQLFSPVGGTVVCQGNAGGPGDGSSGCGFFESAVCNGPCGRLEIALDNGDMLILGHMSNITVAPNQRVNPGQFVGYSGTENGGHVHVEYRQKTPGATASGYTIVDPRTVLTGAAIPGGSSYTPGTGAVAAGAGAGGYPRTLSELWGIV